MKKNTRKEPMRQYECEDLVSFTENYFRDKYLREEQERYDGGNEFNHLEQAVYAATELHDALQSLKSENPSKFNRYGSTLKKVSALTKELPAMLEALKGSTDDEDEYDPQDWMDDDWNDSEDEDDEDDGKENEDDEDDEKQFEESAKPTVRRGKRLDEEFCVKIERPASDLEDETWQCEDFWNKIHENNLEDALDDYFEQAFPDGLGLTEFNDILRFDGDQVLAAIGYTEGDDENSDEYA